MGFQAELSPLELKPELETWDISRDILYLSSYSLH